MKAALIDRYGSNSFVRVADVPVPPIGDTDLLVQVQAVSVNPLDVKIRDGKLKLLLKYRFPLVLGNDLSGIRDRGKRDSLQGRRRDICAIERGPHWRLCGVRRCPGGRRSPEANKRYFRGGSFTTSGRVDSVAIQLTHHLGATVLTAVGQRNVDFVKGPGADIAIDYRSLRFEDVDKDWDVVLDSAGGDTLLKSFECVKRGGVVVSIGSTPSAAFARNWGLGPILVFVFGLMSRKAMAASRVHDARCEYLFMRADGEQLRLITQLVESGAIKAVIDRVFPLDSVRDALACSESGRATGKVVITLN